MDTSGMTQRRPPRWWHLEARRDATERGSFAFFVFLALGGATWAVGSTVFAVQLVRSWGDLAASVASVLFGAVMAWLGVTGVRIWHDD